MTIEQMRKEIAKLEGKIRETNYEHRLLFGAIEEHKNSRLLKSRLNMWKREVKPAYERANARKADMAEALQRAQFIAKSYKEIAAR